MKVVCSFLLILYSLTSYSQVDKIHIGNDADVESAIFQLDATDRGLLIPRMTSAQRLAIPGTNPGLTVYDLDTHSFWYYSSSDYWQEVFNSDVAIPTRISDFDKNTLIQAVRINNVDQINFNVHGVEKLHLTASQFLMEGGNDFLLGSSLNGPGSKFLIDESKSALRAGGTTGFLWSPANIGINSFAAGLDNLVIASNAAAWGEGNSVLGAYSVIFGKNNLTSAENNTIWGFGNEITADNSVCWGTNNICHGWGAVWGALNEATNIHGTIWGIGNDATAFYCTSFGNTTSTTGAHSASWGNVSQANGVSSTAFGYHTDIFRTAGTAFGVYTPIATTSSNLFRVGNGTSLTDRSNAMELIYPDQTAFRGPYQSIVDNGQSTKLEFLDTLLVNNVLDTIGYQIAYDGGPDLLQLKRVGYGISDPLVLATWKKDGKLGLGRVPVNHILEVDGDASSSSGGNWLANSDSRLKKSIHAISDELALDKILGMRGVFYKWDDRITDFSRPKSRQIGFIAQELCELFPSKIVTDHQGYLMAAYGTYDAIFAQAFKAQQASISLLEEQSIKLNVTVRDIKLSQTKNKQLSNELKLTVHALEEILNN